MFIPLTPKQALTAKRNLLSASVISSLDCADVDGYATAFMAMGFESTLLFLGKTPRTKGLFNLHRPKRKHKRLHLTKPLTSEVKLITL